MVSNNHRSVQRRDALRQQERQLDTVLTKASLSVLQECLLVYRDKGVSGDDKKVMTLYAPVEKVAKISQALENNFKVDFIARQLTVWDASREEMRVFGAFDIAEEFGVPIQRAIEKGRITSAQLKEASAKETHDEVAESVLGNASHFSLGHV